MKRLLRAGLIALGIIAVPALAGAAISLSVGPHFLPGFQPVQGGDLNVVVDAVNALQAQTAGTTTGAYKGTFNGTVGATTPSTGAFTSTTATTGVGFPAVTTCSGTTTATCQGQRNTVSVTGLTTAAGATSAAMTVTNATSLAASQIICQPQSYAGTGQPVATNVTPGAGSYSFTVTNAAGSGNLNATVAMGCVVFN